VAAALALGTLLNPLNSSMIAVALISLDREFRVGVGAATWLISGFYLAACVSQPLLGRIADQYGPRRVFLAGLLIVGVTAIAALAAPGFWWLVGCRVLQAIGTSAAFPAGLALIRRIAGDKPPAATLATLGITAAGGAALGPVLGGLLVAFAGWRGVFAVNIPLAVIGLLLALRWLPADEVTPDASVRSVPTSTERPARRTIGDVLRPLDLPGGAYFSGCVIGLLGFLLSLGGRPQWWLLGVCAAAGALLGWRELRVPAPFIDLRGLARDRGLASVLGQQMAVQFVFYAIFYSMPLWLEGVRGFAAERAGLVMLPIAALGVIGTPFAARMVRRRGAGRPLVVGTIGLLAGCAALMLIGDATPLVGILAATVLLGLPNAYNNMALQAALYPAAPPDRAGAAGGIFQTCRYVGAILSTALLGVVFAGGVTSTGLHRTGLVALVVSGLLVLAALDINRRLGKPREAV
jgi:MFS family permease